MNAPLYELTATEAAALIRSGEITSLDLSRSCAERIGSLDPRLKAWVFFDRGKLLGQAERFDEKKAQGERTGVLGGVPVGVKDIFNTANMPTEMGSPIWKDFTPGNDARVVFYLRMADALIAGKTVTAEFAVHAPGPTLNPHDPTRIPGTSSSGSAVAVATGMVPCALGTQTAGSIIRPASYCGVYGFKPSFGLLPRTGMLKTTDSLDTVGFFTRSIEDLKLLLDVMRVRGLDYPISHAKINEASYQNKTGDRWSVAVVRTPVWGLTEKYAQDAFFQFTKTLSQEKDMEVSERTLPPSFARTHEVHETIYDKSIAYYFKNEFKERTLISREIKEMIEHGNTISVDAWKSALSEQNKLSRALDDLFGDADILITLSTAGEAPKVGMPEKRDSCLIWTLCGVPAINLPVLRGPAGLPVGVQIVARRYSDYKLLNFAGRLSEKGLKALALTGEKR